VNGLVLASDGKKMSKRLQNYPDPVLVIRGYGADALRMYLINSPVVRAETLKFQEEGVGEVVRGVLIPWYNAFRFFVQCVERWEASSEQRFRPNADVARSSTNDVDVWILAAIYGLVSFVHQEMRAYRLYTVVPRLLEFVEELTNWFVRLNRNRLKGAGGEAEAMSGLCVLYEVLVTMTLVLSPFTPFFTELLYQQLRRFDPLYENTDPAIPVDVFGKAASVHYLMLPAADSSRLNPVAERRFKTLQVAVKLVRTARERRHIRNNLPLKTVLVVSSLAEDIEAIEYLKAYFLGEINAWDVQFSTEWEKLCVLTTKPNWKVLGKRLGSNMKTVAKGVSELTHAQLIEFMSSGSITISGFEFSREDLVVKREFSGDSKRYEACVSDDGNLLVAVDTTCDEEVVVELRARTLAAAVQKLRKSAGLVVSDKVEVFYDERGSRVTDALQAHKLATVQRIRCLPLPVSLKPKYSLVIASDKIQDPDLSQDPVTIMLCACVVSVDLEAVADLIPDVTAPLKSSQTDAVQMYLQTVDYEDLVSKPGLVVRLDVNKSLLDLKKGVHYFPTALEYVAGSSKRLVEYPWLAPDKESSE